MLRRCCASGFEKARTGSGRKPSYNDDDGMQRATDIRERFLLVISLITFRSKVADNVSRLMHGD